jgi:serine/threonine protein kinase
LLDVVNDTHQDEFSKFPVPGSRTHDVAEALWLVGRIAEGVRYGHRHGIAHLDLKPSNVLLRETPGETWSYPKVSDWGLAKMLLEHSNSIEGISPTYAAPEQFDTETYGSTDDITDIYQLGALAYAVVTGQPPFTGPATAVMQGVLQDDPDPPSSMTPEVPAAVDEVVLKALAKRKADRYEGVLTFRQELDGVFGDVSGASTRRTTGNSARNSISPTPSTESSGPTSTADDGSTASRRSEEALSPVESSSTVDRSGSRTRDTEDDSDGSSSSVSRRAILATLGIGAVGTVDAAGLGGMYLASSDDGSENSVPPTQTSTSETASQNDGGGATTGSGGSGQTLELWLSFITTGARKQQYTDELLSQFESGTGHSVNVTGVPYTDVVSRFRSARAAGEVPHLVEVMTRPGVLAGGAGRVINDLYQSSELVDNTSDLVIDGHRVWGAQSTGERGNLVSLPLGLRPFLTCWRTDHLEEAGIDPGNVDHRAGPLDASEGGDMGEIWARLSRERPGGADDYVSDTTGMKQSDEEYLSYYIAMHGGSKSGVVSVDGSAQTIDTDAGRAAVEWQFRNVEDGAFHRNSINHGDEEATTLHWGGQISINHLQDSTDLWADYQQETPAAFESGRYTWGLPYNGETNAALSWLPSLGFAADADWTQARLDAAMELLEYWVVDPENSIGTARELGFVPVNTDAIQSEDYFGSTPQAEAFWRGACRKTLEQYVPSSIPAVGGSNAITYQIPRRMHQRARQEINNGTPIADAVDVAVAVAGEEIQNVLDENQ